MNVKTPIPRTPAEDELLSRLAATTDGTGPVATLREAARTRFAATGLPHRRVEAYKYTDLKARMRAVPPMAGVPDAAVAKAALGAAPGWDAGTTHRLVFVDGHYRAELSDHAALGQGVSLTSLADALDTAAPACARIGTVAGADTSAKDDAAITLNTAFLQDGAMIEIAAGAKIDKPIELVHVATAEVTAFARHVIAVGAGAMVSFVERFGGPDGSAYHVNVVAELDIAPGATVSWLKREEEGDKALHLSSLVVRVAESASYAQTGFAIGGALARAQTFLTFAGSGATATLNNATLAHTEQHIDTTMVIDHAVPGCTSKEVVKSVIDDRATSVFQGRIVVRPDAQQTDGRMMHRALLLTEGGEAISKPELEIFADDVQCAHGSTSGEIDDEMMFYLMARGIPRDEAERMLIAAFLEEVVDGVADAPLHGPLTERIGNWLSQPRRAA